MFRVTSQKVADILDLKVGYVAFSSEEETQLKRELNEFLKKQDEERYAKNLLDAPKHAYIVTETWQTAGHSFRRGDIVYIKKHTPVGFSANGIVHQFLVTTTPSKSCQRGVYTCGIEEITQHTQRVQELRKNSVK